MSMDRSSFGSNLLIVKHYFTASPVLLGYRNMLSLSRSWLRRFPSYMSRLPLIARRNKLIPLPCTANCSVIRNLLLSQNSPMEQVVFSSPPHLVFHHRFLLSADILSSSPTFMFCLHAYPTHKLLGSVKVTCDELFHDSDKDLFLPVPPPPSLHRRSRRDSTPSPLFTWSRTSSSSTKHMRSTPAPPSSRAVALSRSAHPQSATPRIFPASSRSRPPSPRTCLLL